jgi:AraC family transcriptional regulator of adaptative response / DNA-3-methyladenine glycosylase II
MDDGWQLVGVVTTGIYCVPGRCSGRPKAENVRPFESVADARAAGMRACKVCKPDSLFGDAIVVDLDYRAPLDAGSLLEFFGRRAVLGVEELDGEVYRRSLRLPHGLGVAELRALDGRLLARLWLDDTGDRDVAVAQLRALLDLDADPREILDALGGDPVVGSLVRAAPGRRLPGTVDPHEIAFRAVLGQQVSIAGAATVAGRLTAAYGEPLARPRGGVTHAFPSAAALAEADASEWPMPGSRRRALQGLAGALASDPCLLEDGAERLLALPGIGPWTANYIAMRALHDTDAFLATDLGVKHALDRLGHDSRPAAAEALSQAWRPYRAYALQHLWAATA